MLTYSMFYDGLCDDWTFYWGLLRKLTVSAASVLWSSTSSGNRSRGGRFHTMVTRGRRPMKSIYFRHVPTPTNHMFPVDYISRVLRNRLLNGKRKRRKRGRNGRNERYNVCSIKVRKRRFSSLVIEINNIFVHLQIWLSSYRWQISLRLRSYKNVWKSTAKSSCDSIWRTLMRLGPVFNKEVWSLLFVDSSKVRKEGREVCRDVQRRSTDQAKPFDQPNRSSTWTTTGYCQNRWV